MMAIIPTYVVSIFQSENDSQGFRVPETDLASFLKVLVFNGTVDFRVTREASWAGEAQATMVRGEAKQR